MALTDLIKEIERQILDGQSQAKEEKKDVELLNSRSQVEVLKRFIEK